jgi:endonuclease/exonuclease/phosphatase family metal-dependent hydrolase
MMQFLRKLNLWVVLFTLCAYLAPYISPSQMSFLMFVGVAFPWLLVINLVFLSIWALSRMRYWWYSAAAILIGWTHLTSIFGIHYAPIKKIERLMSKNTDGTSRVNREGVSDNSIRVMTYNIHGGVNPSAKNKIMARLDLSRFLEKQSPDVLCLQEFILPWGDNFNNLMLNDIPFLKTYPYWVRVEGNDLAIFSRFPISNTNILLNRNESNGCTFADIAVNSEQTVRFYSLQLQSNIVSDIADDLAKKKDLTDDDSWFSIGRMLTRFRRHGITRSKDAEIVKSHIRGCSNPVVLCGDFNDIPVSYTYKTLADGFTDSFQAAGKGLGTTYAGHIPALRIDYILTDPRLKPLTCSVFHVPHSDHYPVVSNIQLGQ